MPAAPGIAATISKASYLGSHMEYTLATELGDLFVKDSNVAAPLPVRTSVTARFADHGITLVGSQAGFRDPLS